MPHEESGAPMPPPIGCNWELFLEEQLARGQPEVEFASMKPGDRLLVATKNTRYEFEWREGGTVLLTTNRADRPWGPVTVAGCATGRSGTLRPGYFFCGGRIEFATNDGKVRHRTTPVTSLLVIRADDPATKKTG